MIEPEPLQQVNRTYVRYRGRILSSFSGCDYFRLASHPAVQKAAAIGLEQFGLGVSASRTTSGNLALYQDLEHELANFFAAESALLMPNGYVTSLAVAQALAGQFSHALIDERAHPALCDAASALECPVLKFAHRSVPDSVAAMNRCGSQSRPLVFTDGLFAFNGSIAPLKKYLRHLPRDGWVLVDDAHGAGILGATGKGSLEIEGVSRARVIQCITLSKAFGAYGGAVIGSKTIRKMIWNRSRVFIGSTPIPLPLANAALKSLRLLQRNSGLRRRLIRNSEKVKSALRNAGFTLPQTPSPIVPVTLKSKRALARLKHALLGANIYPPFLNYPGSPENGYFRFVLSSEHSQAQLDALITVLVRHAHDSTAT